MKTVLLCALFLVACRGTVSPFELANERVDAGLKRGFEASNDVGATALKVRLNPAPCECPEYEVFAYGRWMRAFIELDGAALDALRTGDALAVATLRGTVQTRLRAAGNGVKYPVVTPE